MPVATAVLTTGASPRATRGPGARWRRKLAQWGLFVALATPNFFFLILFGYWPVVYNAILSLQRWNMISPTRQFVGLENYRTLLASDSFWEALRHTAVFLVSVTAGSIVVGLALALLLNQRLRGRNIVRTLSFAPYIVGGAAIATTWVFVFDPSFGLIRPILGVFGVTSPAWLSDSQWALPALIIVYVWRNAGFVAAIFIAGLQAIPVELYEAAKVDGAGAWIRFRRITLPMLSPITYFLVVTTVIGVFQAFDIIAIMTHGGPAGSTTVLSWYVYEAAFVRNDAGAAGASATIMFALLILVTVIQARLLRRSVHYS